jgi:hypothetical protein
VLCERLEKELRQSIRSLALFLQERLEDGMLEFIQSLSPHRAGIVEELGDDSAGVGIALLLNLDEGYLAAIIDKDQVVPHDRHVRLPGERRGGSPSWSSRIRPSPGLRSDPLD